MFITFKGKVYRSRKLAESFLISGLGITALPFVADVVLSASPRDVGWLAHALTHIVKRPMQVMLCGSACLTSHRARIFGETCSGSSLSPVSSCSSLRPASRSFTQIQELSSHSYTTFNLHLCCCCLKVDYTNKIMLRNKESYLPSHLAPHGHLKINNT